MDTRKEYKELTQEEKYDVARTKELAEDLWLILENYKEGRCRSIAKTKLEEAVMWATKHITE